MLVLTYWKFLGICYFNTSVMFGFVLFLLYCLDLGRHFKFVLFVFRIFPCFCFGLLNPCPSLLACYACCPILDGCTLVICCQHRLVLLSKQRCGWRFTADILWWFTFLLFVLRIFILWMFHKINMSFFSSWSDLKSIFTPFVNIISFSLYFSLFLPGLGLWVSQR